jgi:hypothetical protein
VSRRHSALLAAWGTAWLQNAVSFDDTLDAVSGPLRAVAADGWQPDELHPVGTALADWKRAGASVLRLALPVPGDVRGLSGPPVFRSQALHNGEAVFGPGFGLTAAESARTPSSARREVRWTRAAIDDAPSDPLSLPDAEYELAEAIRETASVFTGRGGTSWLTDVGGPLSQARRAGERLRLPASHPARGVRVVAQAERLAAVLAVVDSDGTGELTAAAMAERSALLNPLRIAVRRALLAGYNAGAEVSAG